MTNTDVDSVKNETQGTMQKTVEHLEAELTKVRAGKANPTMLDGIMVDYYGNPVPINQVGNITVMDARTLSIQPWEKNMLQPIERSILQANIGITPQNDGNFIRLFLPPLTEERRKELVKRSYAEGENSKVSIRNIRRDAIEKIKKLQKDGLSEDAAKDAEADIQAATDRFIISIEKHLSSKEKRDHDRITDGYNRFQFSNTKNLFLMAFFKEFKDFAMRGNLVDIAVAFVMGGSFGKVVTSLTEGMIAPIVGMLTGKDLSENVYIIKPEIKDAAGKVTDPGVILKWGAFITAVVDFIIVAFVMFLIVKAINSLKKKEAPAAAPPVELSSTDKLLIEIRDALKK